MTYEYNKSDSLLNDFPNPFKFENVFLFLAAAFTAAGGIESFIIAKDLFKRHEDKSAVLVILVAALVTSFAVKLLIQALSQMRFYLGRKFPRGLAGEIPQTQTGMGRGAEAIMETMRNRALDFPEPRGALNGMLYSLVKDLVTSPIPVQAAAVQHFHSLIAMATLFASLVVSYFVFQGTAYEGFASWLYLPMSGLSLLTPFFRPEALTLNTIAGADTEDASNKTLYKLIGLLVLSIMAPVLVPRIAPSIEIAPMWTASALLLLGSMVASALFFRAVVSRLDSAAMTSVSCEQTTIAMNCPPAQLWTEIGRDFQSSWERNIPNRTYAYVPPEVNQGERGSFAGLVLEETQPVPTSTMQFATWAEAFQTPYSRYLLLLGAWGSAMAGAAAVSAVYLTGQFASMSRVEVGRAILIVMALGMVAALSFRIGHLLWSRMQFRSRLFWIENMGTFQTSTISVGNQFRGSAQSSSTLTRVEDATLRVWVTDIVSVSFGKDSPRSIIAMGPADGIAKSLAERLIAFAAMQSSVAAPTNTRDLHRAAAIGTLDAALRQSVNQAMQSDTPLQVGAEHQAVKQVAVPTGRVTGKVRFYNQERKFGFISDRNNNDYFFNENYLRGAAPAAGTVVEFDVHQGPKGSVARNILFKEVA